MISPAKKSSFYSSSDHIRQAEEPVSNELAPESYRTQFRKDYARLIHSASLRRLCGKTQLYPGVESDFFRNRFSHSLEVAQIAKSIAIKLNAEETFADGNALDLDTDLVEFSALAHDIGHPPFGHQGEKALDQCMFGEGGFEGNAQTLRIISRIEKKFLIDSINAPAGIKSGDDMRVGLNLTSRTIASILKYNKPIPFTESDRVVEANGESDTASIDPVKGYYGSDKELVKFVQQNVLDSKDVSKITKFKTVECSIMDLADDIAYSTYDLEDGLKAGFYHPLDIIFSKESLLEKVAAKVNEKISGTVTVKDIKQVFIEIFDRWLFPVKFDNKKQFDFNEQLEFMQKTYETSKLISKSGHTRTGLTSFLVGKFIRGVKININNDYPQLSEVYLDEPIKIIVETLKHFNYESMIISPRLRIAEFRGQEIVRKIFDSLKNQNRKGYQLMPKDFQEIYRSINDTEKNRVICDFIAGMTDRYCIEFYGRLTSENPETIFKPL